MYHRRVFQDNQTLLNDNKKKNSEEGMLHKGARMPSCHGLSRCVRMHVYIINPQHTCALYLVGVCVVTVLGCGYCTWSVYLVVTVLGCGYCTRLVCLALFRRQCLLRVLKG